MNSKIRTDLALEARELWRESAGKTSELEGVRADERQQNGFTVSTVDILNSLGEKALGKPAGRYVTVELDALLRREENSFADACALIADALRSMAKLEENVSVLVVGLGNRGITPDAVGPETVDCIMVTRHLKESLPRDFAAFRPVAALCSGVLGTTGIESGSLVSAAVELLRPGLVIAVDALASRSVGRLCKTVQIADTGIVPGSGVGNSRRALNCETLGVPVIALGVPTVVDAATLALDLSSGSAAPPHPALADAEGMIVTPRDIDRSVRDMGKLLGYSINLALHPGLTLADVDMFLS